MSQKIKSLSPDSAALAERSGCLFLALWEELLRMRRVVLKSSGLDDIHDLRVASRRFRALLDIFYPFLPKAGRAELKKSIRKITRSLGGLRNVDEAQLFFQSRSMELQHSETVFLALSNLRADELQRIVKSLKSFDRHSLDHSVRKMISGLNDKKVVSRKRSSLPAYLSEVSVRKYMPVHESLSTATQQENSATRHALRIAIKKWRYFLEIAEQLLDCDYSAILDLLKEYQSLLGKMNDLKEFELLLGGLKVPVDDQSKITRILAQEEAALLRQFRQLMEQKSLSFLDFE